MSMDYEGRRPEDLTANSDAPLFAPNPVWERGRKRRGVRRAAPVAAPAATVDREPRSFAPVEDDPMTLDRPVPPPAAAPAEPATTADGGMFAPIGRSTTAGAARSRGEGRARSGLMIGGALAVLLGVGAVGWVASHDRDSIPTIAPGEGSAEVAESTALPPVTTPPTPGAQALQQAEAAAPTPAATAEASRPAPRARVQTARNESRPTPTRVRPAAAAASAGDAAVNTSATIPSGPQPYSTLNPGAAPTTVTPAPVPPPAAAQTAAPEIPVTPPTAPAEPSTTTAPQEATAPTDTPPSV